MKDLLKKAIVACLRWEAKAVLRRFRPHVVAITGSVGKTSTKDAIYAALARTEHVRKSEKSFNSEVGLPLTILGLSNAWSNPLRWIQNLIDGLMVAAWGTRYPRWLVLEVGADRPGDIKSVAKWLPVDVAVITRLPEVMVHVEFFASPQEVVEEKASLIGALKQDGTLVLYGDDERTARLAERAVGKHILTFGFEGGNDVRAKSLKILYSEGKHKHPVGMSAELVVGESSAPLVVAGAIGPHSFMPALAAAAVAKALGKSLDEILEGLGGYEPPAGRMRLIEGIKETTIIDDTYNSSPAAAVAALETLHSIKKSAHARRIAMLADMTELGRHSIDEHRKLGSVVAQTCDLLVVVGFRARDIAQGALAAGMREDQILQFEDSSKAGEELAAAVGPGDIVLIKGSQVMRMEKATEELMAHPERASELLVRQDPEWRKR